MVAVVSEQVRRCLTESPLIGNQHLGRKVHDAYLLHTIVSAKEVSPATRMLFFSRVCVGEEGSLRAAYNSKKRHLMHVRRWAISSFCCRLGLRYQHNSDFPIPAFNACSPCKFGN